MPLNHVAFSAKDLKASKEFYLAALAPLGYKVWMDKEEFVALAKYGPDLWMFQKKDEYEEKDFKPIPLHVAFEASSHKKVRAFHAAALKAGATCNGPPGERPHYTAGYYAAFITDLDGNNIEAVYYNPWWLSLLNNAPYILGGAVAIGAWFAGKSGLV